MKNLEKLFSCVVFSSSRNRYQTTFRYVLLQYHILQIILSNTESVCYDITIKCILSSLINLQGKLQNVENGLAEFIRESKVEGTAKEEVLHKLQKFFVLSEKEAKEKIVKYWNTEKPGE